MRRANINPISNKKKPATAKNPAAMLLKSVPSHHPNPNPIKNRKKKAKKKADAEKAASEDAAPVEENKENKSEE